MSVSLLLVPLAIAGIGAFQIGRAEKDVHGRNVCHVQTRMRDRNLLEAALSDTKAITSQTQETITAEWHGVRALFRPNEQGIWQVDFTGEVDEKRAMDIAGAVDQAYGRQVQQAVLTRLKAQASSAGMAVASETLEDDDSVTLVLDIGRER